ncbi:hypothetical protein AX16_006321 [Volvariella volvacea WC 439]|nr:hypothetical protein AX16_006321 [Volvariella volvacea WC 439]
MGILLAPYNDSMRLGQGYNSFLQSPCLYNAVEVKAPASQRTKTGINTSQTVSYSSHVVTKISDLTRSMNLSTGSSIKNGSLALSGNASSIDESKFAESDLNVILSVKVVNQSYQSNEETQKFDVKSATNNLGGSQKKNDRFHEVYGDCYISGFIEGGELHGVISIKALDSSKKEEVKAKIIGDLNGSGPDGFTFDPSGYTGAFGTNLRESEVTIAVNWSGGGRIKPDDEEWTLESLYRVASAFPSKVAVCPQKTWAILTRYNNNPQFVKWSIENNIMPKDFSHVESYASDLLDTYMVYKNNIRRIQSILANPSDYLLGPASNPINIAVKDLVEERKGMKSEMAKIMAQVDKLDETPESLEKLMADLKIKSPELWANRLPIPKSLSHQVRALQRFARLSTDPYIHDDSVPSSDPNWPLKEPAVRLYDDNAALRLSELERKALDAQINRWVLAAYQFDAAGITPSTSAADTQGWEKLRDEIRMNAIFSSKYKWPSSIKMQMSTTAGLSLSVVFGEELGDGTASTQTKDVQTAAVTLGPSERVNKVRIGKSTHSNKGVISFINIQTTSGQDISVGKAPRLGSDIIDLSLPASHKGLAFLLAVKKSEESGSAERLLVAWK